MMRDDHVHRDFHWGIWNLGPSTAAWARKRLAPFLRGGELRESYSRAEDDPSGQLELIEGASGESVRVVCPDVRAFPEPLQLLVAMHVGAISERYETFLGERGIVVDRPVVADEDLVGYLSLVLSRGNRRFDDWAMRNAFTVELGGEARERPPCLDPELLDCSPFARTLVAADRFSRFDPRADQRPLPIVVGGTARDFALAYALDRLVGPALWLPVGDACGDHEDRVVEAVARAADAHLGRGQRDRHAVVVSVSAPSDVADWAQRLGAVPYRLHGDYRTADMSELDFEPGRRVLAVDHAGESRFEPFQGYEMATTLDPPVPAFASRENPQAVKWLVDVQIGGYEPPPRTAIGESLQRAEVWASETSRSSRGGTTFMSHSMGLVLASSPLRQVLARPRLRTPDADEILRRLLESDGMVAKASDKGHYSARFDRAVAEPGCSRR